MKEKIKQKIDELLDAEVLLVPSKNGLQVVPRPDNYRPGDIPGAYIAPDRVAQSHGIGHGIKVEGMDKNMENGANSLREFFQDLMNAPKD